MVQATGNDISNQSQYKYSSTTTLPDTTRFDWNITLIEELYIVKPAESQGIYECSTIYLLDDRSYDVELFEKDCLTTPTYLNGDIFRFPLKFRAADETESGAPDYDITTKLDWEYNQTMIETSSLWTANKTGGYSEFCIRVNNYLPSSVWDGNSVGADPWYREMHFLEATYKIEVDSLTDFNTTIDVIRTNATDGGEDFIDYEEEIVVYQCEDDFTQISPVVELTQGDYLQLCVRTQPGSRFGVHSIKELDVSQDDMNLYPYVDGYLDSPLTFTECTDSNTTVAICKAKMQLLSAYFDDYTPSDLFANGTVKLDYVGRRLTVDVPMNANLGGRNIVGEGGSRMLAEEEGGGFGITIELDGSNQKESDAASVTMKGVASATMAAIAAVGIV